MPRRKTDSEFIKEVYDLVGDEYIFLDTYQGSNIKIRVKHSLCGSLYEVRPNDFLNGKRCPYCSISAKKTDTQFKKEIKSLVGNEYTFIEPYVNSYTKIKVKHNKCNNVYKVTPHNFLSGKRCPYCAGNIKKTDEYFKKEIYNRVSDEYTVLGSYVNSAIKIKVKHNKCGTIYEVKPNDFLNGKRCPYCYGKMKKTDTKFKREVESIVGNEYTFLDSYVDSKSKIKVRHNKCNTVYEVRPDMFLKGERCPYCNSPKGEISINKILKSLGIKYEYQKTFDDLKDSRLLSYDFYIPSQDILIEYQGQQHYQPVGYFGGADTFELQQKHDKMKSDYAKDNGYKLITVPYTQDTFSKIKKYLIKHGLK